VIIEANTRVEDNCVLEPGVIIGKDVTIGHHTKIGMGARVTNKVTIGSGSIIKIGEIILKDMIYKMVFKRGAWIYREDSLDHKNEE
jgi:UDP-3-O-[3-hydroxymyristoyl] glucosamine N-acyltransferase